MSKQRRKAETVECDPVDLAAEQVERLTAIDRWLRNEPPSGDSGAPVIQG